MTNNPFITRFESLPDSLAIFPLPGAIVMPRAELPLNIFEPRYLNMINDALAGHRMIGMIQPDPESDDNAIYRTGCAARITQYRETSDCRIELVLTGVCRFDAGRELSTTRGYRLIVPDWSRFNGDYDDHEGSLDAKHDELLETLNRYFEVKGYETDMAMLEQLPVSRLVDSLTMALPFSTQEKQMLLETVAVETRLAHFVALIDGAFDLPDSVTRH